MDGPAGLEGHSVWRFDTARHFYLRERTRELLARPANHDQHLSIIGTRAPEVVVVVRADGEGQAVRAAVVADRAGLAIVSRDDPDLAPFLCRQRGIDARDLSGQLFPAKAVGEVLVQGAEAIPLSRRRRDAESPLVGDEGLNRQHRHGEGGRHGAPQRQHREQCRPHPAPALSLRETFHDQGPRSQQHGKGRTQVVRLAVLHGQDDKGHDEHDGEGPEAPASGAEEQPTQPHQPDRRVQRMQVEDLGSGEAERRERDVLVARRIPHELEGGPVVPQLPEHVRAQEHEGQHYAFPQLPPGQVPAKGGDKHSDGQAEREEQQADLVQKAYADHQAERAPQPHIVGAREAGHEQGGHRPEHEIEGVHRVETGEGQVLGSDRHRQPRQRLCEAPPAELAGQPGRQPHQEPEEQCRHEPDREETIAEKTADTREHEDRQRGVIHVAPIEMAGAGEVVELVAEQTVAPAGGELEGHDSQHGGEHEGRRRAIRGIRGAGCSRRAGHAPAVAKFGLRTRIL